MYIGTVTIYLNDDTYSGKIINANNLQVNGKYIHEVHYPNEFAQEAEYPELSWDEVNIECYDLEEEDFDLITNITINNFDLDDVLYCYQEELDWIRCYKDFHANCLVIIAE